MKTVRLDDMVKGWFVGSFTPTAFHTETCEVAIKHYKAGDSEAAHYHQVATEVTAIISGEVQMCDTTWGPGDIIVLSPGDVTAFVCLKDAVTVCVKSPGALQDKFEI